ncbi:hydantoinase/oxoprolinase family protein [Pseudonocardia sp. KRD-184]|uniref:Hydantoinase/oxoprolinase family protein n=1 Tax=Pseudonocardia oceani TaxID=2792013 RepID=A0ABS6UE72_9PSEU|nr:hydantoinase/oxoprolinase family protein [Pseudonocardia oceani]MBW0089142.1 hydantoinase/oxoprolinase family protein [Pseudonocardia oceani]MBW0095968.1 hydantoinase/oxoprolinase family protein [Pseudonocardia oceani]MBW0108856.1 hydantoinase/oxoprolinase family protein [Pseudonocardia oceani]MBW0120199.1 hydantoinase/oxoprolinase family protein [Pseudonocardia oceani]MBW0130243.1 hydantoinase/oxoprolinase family protein [Pseudonocardia oceani]
MRIGIDVGGTNTDAVLVDGTMVVAETKSATTEDVTSGIAAALAALQAAAPHRPSSIQGVMIGTTHFINAIVQGRDLAPTAAIRLGLPATRALPPMSGWPARLVQAVRGRSYLCHGGHEIDGRTIAPLRREELVRAAEDILSNGVRAVAVSSVYSPVNAECELEAAEILGPLLPHVSISLSHRIGRMGLLERENATIVNASLGELAGRICAGLAATVAAAGIDAPLFLSQNDGTLMDVEHARHFPVATFASGPTNSMRGAAFLSGLHDCAVVDVGGTTTDVGMLRNGFPREASTEISVGGIRTNFRMPDVLSIGLGGGSRVHSDPLRIGPDSVGYRLTQESLVFGGDTLTCTDVAVAAGIADIGDAGLVRGLAPALVAAVRARIAEQIGSVVDRVRTADEATPVVAVGGGSILVPEVLPGVGLVHRPAHHATANAIGAAIAQVGGEVDRMYSVGPGQRHRLLDEAKQEAVDKAVAAGAEPNSVQIVDVDEVPLAYLPGNATRIRVKAAGDLALAP